MGNVPVEKHGRRDVTTNSCSTVLLPHVTRANYIAMRDKSYVNNFPNLPAIETSGWRLDKGIYLPLHNLASPAPHAVIELIECKKAVQANAVVAKMPCRVHIFESAMANGVPTFEVMHKRPVLMKKMNN